MIFLYIDPGTGSMLFAVLMGIIGTLIFFLRKLVIKFKFIISGGKKETMNENKIPFLIFSDHKRYWNVFRPVCDEFEKRKTELVYWTASPDDPALKSDYKYVRCEFIGEGNKAFSKLNLMQAGICLSTTPGLDVYQWKRSKNTDWYVHIYHMVTAGIMYRMFGLDEYDAVLLTGPLQEGYIRKLEELRGIKKKELFMTGCTYMDALYERFVERGEQENRSDGKINVLVAPTWGNGGLLKKFGSRFIDALLKTDFNIVIRPHPQTMISEKDVIEPLISKYKDNKRIVWNHDNDNFEALYNADIMISDYSGVIFDFALAMGKPVIYTDTHLDVSEYDAAWIDEPLWNFGALERVGRKLSEEDFDKMDEIVRELLEDPEFEKGRKSVIDEVWQCRGSSAVLTADYMIRKYEELGKERSKDQAG